LIRLATWQLASWLRLTRKEVFMKKKFLAIGLVFFLMMGQAQALPMGCNALNTYGVNLYRAGHTQAADAIFALLDGMGCYDGSGL
jgi:hypothetical protein